MNSDAAPPQEDVTDLGEPRRKSAARLSRRTQSRVETRRRVGNYRVIALLGEGGMAQVHLAVKHGPAGFKKLLVVKSMREDLVDPIYVKSFMHEARLAAQLNHPNVIQTYEVGEDDGQLFIAMEYVEGQSMRAVQRRVAPKRLPMHVQLRILAEIARGLHHAHTLKSFDGSALQVVHRDVSPQNVMLTYDGQVKLLDFGIAKAQGSDELTREGMIKGKIDYMAPEQLRGDAIDQRADVFALGVMLWEALTGMRFSGGAEVAEITKMHNRIMGREQKLRNVAPETPMRLVEICEQAIALDPKDRFTTAEAFDRAIGEYLSDTSKMTDSQQLAQIMEGLFTNERKKLRALLEEQMRVISDAEASGEDDFEMLVVHEPDVTSGTPASKSSMIARTGPRALPGEAQEPPQESARASSAFQVAVAAGIIAIGVAAGVYFAPRRDTQQASDTRTEPVRTATPAGTPTEASTVEVRIDVAPRTATVKLDGVSIAVPFTGRLAREAQLHQVEVSADGYEPMSRGVSFAENVALDLVLVPVDRGRTGRANPRVGARPNTAAVATTGQPTVTPQVVATPQPATPTPPPTPTPTPTPGRRSPVIESSNPYEE